VANRKKQWEEKRHKRLEAEAAAAAAARRKRLMTRAALGAGVVVVAAVVAILAASGGGSSKVHGVGSTAGLQTTAVPWAPETTQLTTRLQALNLPAQSDAAYHVHAELVVYVNGHKAPVPAQIGIDPQGQFLAPLHTHDTSGVIHIEAAQQYPFTLGQFFTIWGVKFTDTQLGGYTAVGGNVLRAYANGKPITHPVTYVMQPHDLILVGFGRPGSFPTRYSFGFTAGQ